MSNKKKDDAVSLQEEYYRTTADRYDSLHVSSGADPEHDLALALLSAMINYYKISSILDLGAGTGRTMLYLKEKHPEVKVMGIEPVEALRIKGYEKGISKEALIDGDGANMSFGDRSFDLVCEFGVLHHVRNPEKVVNEMLRVAGKAIFISDSNNFGQGSWMIRTIKQALNFLGLWKLYNYIRTGGRIYQVSEKDGVFYSYSVFSNMAQIRKACRLVHVFNVRGDGANAYRSAPHVALMGIK